MPIPDSKPDLAAQAAEARERGASHIRPTQEEITWPDLLRIYAIILAVIGILAFVGIAVVVDIFDGDSSSGGQRVGDTCVDDFTLGPDGRWYGSTHACYSASDRYSEPPVRLSKGDRY